MLSRTRIFNVKFLTSVCRRFATRQYIFRYGNLARNRISNCHSHFGVSTRSICDELATESGVTGLNENSPGLELNGKVREQDNIPGTEVECKLSTCRNDIAINSMGKDSPNRISTNLVFNKSSLTNDLKPVDGGDFSESKTVKHIDNKSTNHGIINYPSASQFHLPSDWRKSHLGSPGIKFPGDIYVIKSTRDELQHMDVLEGFLQEQALGFDTEHCPVQHQVCVVQLATNDKAVLWHCLNFKNKMPHYLKELLVGNVKKVGHACMDDAIMISKQFQEEPQNLIDTCSWARDLHCIPQSLQGLCAIFLGKHLSKTHQQSNWKKENLSPGQIHYAATDAWISLKVYEEMKSHADRLGVALTPMYKNLQERYQEVLTSRRLKNRRRRQRIKERKQELKAKALNAQEQNAIATNYDSVLETNIFEGTIQGDSELQNSFSQDQIQANNKDDKKVKKKSAGSKQRHKKFLAKFHSLE